jgi:hypothetical protein
MLWFQAETIFADPPCQKPNIIQKRFIENIQDIKIKQIITDI